MIEEDVFAQTLAYYHSVGDVNANAFSSLPVDESVRVPSLWVFEVYPPGFIGDVYKRIEELGWRGRSEKYDFIDFIGRMREKTYGGAFLNLGYVTEAGGGRFFNNWNADIPSEVRGIHISAFQPVPSLTVMCYIFCLKGDAVCAIEGDLRSDFKTYIQKCKNEFLVVDVLAQKKNAVLLTRGYLRSVCVGWVGDNFPGYFSSGDCVKSHPTCEVMLLNSAVPFSKEIVRDSYMDIIGLKSRSSVWVCDKLKGLFFKIPFDFDDGPHAVLSGNINNILSDEELKFYGGATKEDKFVSWCGGLSDTLSMWVVYAFSHDLSASVARARDMYGGISLKDIASAARAYHAVNSKQLELQKNSVHFAADLNKLCGDNVGFDCGEYLFAGIGSRSSLKKFPVLLHKLLLRNSCQISEGREQLSIISGQFGHVLSTIASERLASANMSLQRAMLFFTIIAALFTLIGVADKIDGIVKIFRGVFMFCVNVFEL